MNSARVGLRRGAPDSACALFALQRRHCLHGSLAVFFQFALAPRIRASVAPKRTSIERMTLSHLKRLTMMWSVLRKIGNRFLGARLARLPRHLACARGRFRAHRRHAPEMLADAKKAGINAILLTDHYVRRTTSSRKVGAACTMGVVHPGLGSQRLFDLSG